MEWTELPSEAELNATVAGENQVNLVTVSALVVNHSNAASPPNLTSTLFATPTSSLPVSEVTVKTTVKEFACVLGEWSEPDFLRYACSGHPIASWIATIFLLSMICFGFVKCLVAHGPCNLYDLRRTGVSFPKRPELLVLLCSSLPTVFIVIARPLVDLEEVNYKTFARGWGLAQTRFFFDLFTRTASIYHLVYWAYRTPIISVLWRAHLVQQHWCTLWANRPKPQLKSVTPSRAPSGSVASPRPRVKGKPVRTGRTREYGYQHKRTNSIGKSGKAGGDSHKSGSVSSKTITEGTASPDNQGDREASTQVTSAGGVSVIAPQPLFMGQPNMMMMNFNTSYPNPAMISAMGGSEHSSPYLGQSGMIQFPGQAFGGVFPGSMSGQSGEFVPGMGYGMNFGMNMGTPIGMMPGQNQINPLLNNNSFGPRISESRVSEQAATTEVKPTVEAEPRVKLQLLPHFTKENVIPTREFCVTCKRAIPICIYSVALFITLPSLQSFDLVEEKDFSAARCTTWCRSYFYYDLVMLVAMPTLMIVIAFYHGALSKKQLNGGNKMIYRLRCYYVTFILLNIPIFVTMITSIGFRLSKQEYQSIYGTGILIALTAYHANFALKATVYTTSCNCICCTDSCLLRCNWLNRFIVYFTTPVATKDHEVLMDGIVIPVQMENDKICK